MTPKAADFAKVIRRVGRTHEAETFAGFTFTRYEGAYSRVTCVVEGSTPIHPWTGEQATEFNVKTGERDPIELYYNNQIPFTAGRIKRLADELAQIAAASRK